MTASSGDRIPLRKTGKVVFFINHVTSSHDSSLLYKLAL